MSPKFRGDQEDWLDDVEPPASRGTPASAQCGTLPELDASRANATVLELFPKQSLVALDGSGERRLCGHKLTRGLAPSAKRERSPACVGDRVRVESGIITARAPRRNRLIRPSPNAGGGLLHVLAANIDCLVVVAAAKAPDFSAGVVDRFLVAASAQRIEAILCVNKMDLLPAGAEKPWGCYAAAQVRLVEASVQAGSGLSELSDLLRGKTAAFCGHSGVGKTSLLRRLLADEGFGRVGEVSAATDKGRHTTTSAVLVPGLQGGAFIDMPGIMNFGLLDVAASELLRHFPDLLEAARLCPPDCAHENRPACALAGLPRYPSYRGILAALLHP